MKTTINKKLAIGLTTFVLLTQPVFGQIAIFGGSDCGQWIENSKSNFSLRAWLLGYMSGLNAGLSDTPNDRLNKINSAEQIFLWMDNFCTKNPLKTVNEGGNALFRELRTK
jgi:hypothetical protein